MIFHVHRWTKWSDPVAAADRFSPLTYLVQVRSCRGCGLMRQVVVGSPPLTTIKIEDRLASTQPLMTKEQ